ncbi:Ubiquinone/menaquinone biosynthesis C-methylase UbiE [Streptomyces sp. DvalAA-14]|uniref:class I SAM-dependent methyltransferase n=1 Tax=unclassified Streptomyces TaxID=2593676 RepID=UPI00081B20E0|nr:MULTISPECIES: class I SAM-dependent methyltransferase [unclassified Streptomyces]MYS20549.1 methyltransferase domain-containing protein [Streptomyces sp. SID4948]SCD71502.1 Ubiquinone/menaquinone biosynthesis C-methylase UbiE [Streptomyces sp. DvalAA-14]
MTIFDAFERRAWSGQAEAYGRTYGLLCGHTAPRLLDAAGVEAAAGVGGGAGIRVLDVGTGTGTVAAAASARGAEVIAVDAEPSMVAAAARAVPAAEVRLAALPHLPFPDAHVDAVVGNFVLNHVGKPRAALGELRRVVRPGGRVALTVWPSPPSPGQALLGRAVQAAGVARPADAPMLDPLDDFPRTEDGLVGLLAAAGFTGAVAETLAWEHRVHPDVWWAGPAAGIASLGQLLAAQSPEVVAGVRRQYELLAREFALPDGRLALPHTAVLVAAARP